MARHHGVAVVEGTDGRSSPELSHVGHAGPLLRSRPRRLHAFMHLHLVLPSLLALPREVLSASSALAALASRALPPRHEPRGLDAVVLATAGLPRDTPLAPLAARGAGLAMASGTIARADPITMVAGRDDVLLGGRVDDVSVADTQAFITLLNAHFASDGLTFIAARPDAWFVQFADFAVPQTTPLAQVHGALHAHQPRGEHAARWKRWNSEMQMLLHEHALNVARERDGQSPVTGVWIADAGPAVPSAGRKAVDWFAAVGRTGDVARGLALAHACAASPPPATFTQWTATTDAVVILSPLHTAAELQTATDAWLSPTLAALDRGTLTELTIAADDNHDAFIWSPHATKWWMRWRGASATPFVPPAVPDR